MTRTPRRRPSPTLVVACISLAFALSGTGYAVTRLPANSVGTAQLKKNAVTSVKVKNGALLATDFAVSQIPPGPPGLAGPSGDKGDVGANGPPGLIGLETVVAGSALDSTPSKVAAAPCPSGKKVVGGGALVSPFAGIVIKLSRPINFDLAGWIVQAQEDTPVSESWGVGAYALCARVAP